MKRLIVTIAGSLVLTGCASVPDDGGISRVNEIYSAQTNDEVLLPRLDSKPPAQSTLDQILASPLELEDAERLSLQLNPLVRTKMAVVGLAEADYAQAARMENPGISFERFSSEDYAASAIFDLGGIFLMPLKRRIEKSRLERSRFEAAISVMDHVAQTRTAWLDAVTTKQISNLTQRSLLSADTSNTLARQMSALGHSSSADAVNSETFLAQMRATVLRARQSETAARERLVRQLGLWGMNARALKVPDQLPDIPAKPMGIPFVEREAIDRRLDVQLAKANLESMASNLKLSRRNPFLSAIEFGPVVESAEGERERGYEIELRLPIFDTGAVKNRRNRILLEQAQADAEVVAITAASQAREAMSAYQGNWDIANNMQNVVLPLRRRLTEEKMLEYNGMLISVFDLLSDVRAATQIEIDYINAVRDFWISDTALQQAMTGAGMGGGVMPGGSAGAAPAESAGH